MPFILSSSNHIYIAKYPPLEMISIKIWETPLSWHLKCALPVGVRVLKTRVLKLSIDNDNTEGAEILCMRMFGIAQNMVGLIQNNIKQRKTELTTGGEALGKVHIRRGIFHGDSLSSLLFVISLIRALTLVLRKVKFGYDPGDGKGMINHLLFMDDLKKPPGTKKMRSLNVDENENYKYLGVLEADDVKHSQMKDRIQKEYFRTVKTILNSIREIR